MSLCGLIVAPRFGLHALGTLGSTVVAADRRARQDNANTYCAGLSLGGSGWRLPTLTELESIVDTAYRPTIDPTAFPSTPADWFWTSSPYVGSSGFGWIVYFNYGSSAYDDTASTNRVRCVR